MITRLEPCAKDTPAERPRGRAAWRFTLVLAAMAYLALVLFDEIESPLFSMILLLLVAWELVHSRRARI